MLAVRHVDATAVVLPINVVVMHAHLSYLNMYAAYSASMKGSLMATTLTSSRWRQARITSRPMRPNPAGATPGAAAGTCVGKRLQIAQNAQDRHAPLMPIFRGSSVAVAAARTDTQRCLLMLRAGARTPELHVSEAML